MGLIIQSLHKSCKVWVLALGLSFVGLRFRVWRFGFGAWIWDSGIGF